MSILEKVKEIVIDQLRVKPEEVLGDSACSRFRSRLIGYCRNYNGY